MTSEARCVTRGGHLLLFFLLFSSLAATGLFADAVPATTDEPAAEISSPQEGDLIDPVIAPEVKSSHRTEALLASVTVFVLAVFLGFELITKVPPTLHTPLMSGSNAISGITLVGAVLTAGAGFSQLGSVLGLLAVILATINVVGGFLVTDRMLEMFQKKK